MAITLISHKRNKVGGKIKLSVPSGDILTGFGTPIAMISAITGKSIYAKSIVLFLDYNSAAYTGNTNIQFVYTTSGTVIATFTGVLAATSDQTEQAVPVAPENEAGNGINMIVQTGNPSTGNSPVEVEIEYIILPN